MESTSKKSGRAKRSTSQRRVWGLRAKRLALSVVFASLTLVTAGTLTIHRVVDSELLRKATAEVIGRNFGEASADVFRGGQASLTKTRWLTKMYGFRTVIHLAWSGNSADQEEAHYFSSQGIGYHRFSWRPDSVPDPGEIAEALRLIREAPKPIFVHCIGGKDRTGGLVGIMDSMDGVDLAHVEGDWHRYGLPNPAWQGAVRESASLLD